MRSKTRIVIVIGVTLLCAALSRAEKLTHNFSDLCTTGKISWTGTTIGTVTASPELTYTCYSKAKFDYVDYYFILLDESSSYVVTSAAVEDLTKIVITRLPSLPKGASGDMKFWISTDGSSWTEITSSAEYNSHLVEVPMPEKGNYYLKIGRTSDRDLQIREIDYYVSPCHCLKVVSE